jgi:hypothetical protein
LEEFRTSKLLRLIDDPSLADHDVRNRLLDCQQSWSDVFQDLLHLRVAMTTDPEHKHVALDHLVEELGHNNNLRKQRQSRHRPIADPMFVSTMDWFRDQMLYRSDMVRTLLMHVVLEGSGEIWHREAARAFPDLPHFEDHGEDDGAHVTMGLDLLNRASLTEIDELREALAEGWAMITQLCDRIAFIALAEDATSELSKC